ncbi:uncharacterized protein FOMMEDRAFT_162293 [Fomitiporia mediterranea MF3/22]|uniref:uncharacterized protein n=1 Tax=Fomitiporia mediterranea (strain MF3/22) TaxID=694068 RepID=UPI00044097E3|nr:uncharacterized protein FOMMEDRAFT_162293 [Fomitiporia mediterranea MF3/22]EJC97949.1 hypothetical protein FOMMEDRAFT_162293 [Fomitiporia mediterranea MF3/22]
MITSAEASVISISMEAILYGISVPMFILTMWILRQRQRRGVHYAMIISACALQTLATMELIVNIIRIYQDFLTIGPFLPRGPEQFFQDVTQRTWITKSWLYNIQTLILDGVVIYRTYIVWKKIYIIIIPVLGWLALLVTCVCLNVAFATAVEHKDDMFAKPTGQWITAVYTTTLVTNLSATTLLALRIWRVNREASEYRSQGRVASVLRSVIESRAIYSVTAALITFVITSLGVYVLFYMTSPIISIVFNMIIIRLGFATECHLPVVSTTVQQGRRFEPSSQGNRDSIRASRENSGFGMKSLEVEITQHVETDADATSIAETGREEGRRLASEAARIPL